MSGIGVIPRDDLLVWLHTKFLFCRDHVGRKIPGRDLVFCAKSQLLPLVSDFDDAPNMMSSSSLFLFLVSGMRKYP